ncbi:hypothetical protein Cabys_970 [Caldithrix abyssi DSM 13497]|uniref:Uncharacterized protein n=1 Tax=Caldithrix abyssi DSM 13497 TaxID=880073 RepID=A0A1J1C5Z4_CALAY|nr:hypothetical protein Cabys_970 [Caldithrix abyssi DSM 13497]
MVVFIPAKMFLIAASPPWIKKTRFMGRFLVSTPIFLYI